MTATAAVDATGLVKTFGQLRAVDGIDLHVGQGEIFGVDVAREPHRIASWSW